jgi:hypothetical protein
MVVDSGRHLSPGDWPLGTALSPRETDTMKRALLVALVALVGCKAAPPPPPPAPARPVPAIDQQKFEALYRSAKTMQASLSVGLTYVKFGELKQALATEISIAADKASSEREKALVAAYADILTTLQDSAALWEKQIKDHNPELVREGELIVEGAVVPIVQKYGIPQRPRKRTFESIGKVVRWNVAGPNAMQAAWEVAGKQMARANAMYYADEGGWAKASEAVTMPTPAAAPTDEPAQPQRAKVAAGPSATPRNETHESLLKDSPNLQGNQLAQVVRNGKTPACLAAARSRFLKLNMANDALWAIECNKGGAYIITISHVPNGGASIEPCEGAAVKCFDE